MRRRKVMEAACMGQHLIKLLHPALMGPGNSPAPAVTAFRVDAWLVFPVRGSAPTEGKQALRM
jgi:hypothetical protein